MLDQPVHELHPHIPYKELSREEDLHLKKQVYYFFPFVRSLYQVLLRDRNLSSSEQVIDPSVITNLKSLAIYYGSALVYGNYDIKQEQRLIEELYKNIGKPPDAVREILESVSENKFNKSDGDLEDYLFGTVPTQEIDTLNLPGGPYYNQDTAGGILNLDQEERFDLVENISKYIAQNKNNLPISIFGNVARGIIDGAALFSGLQQNYIQSNFHFFRASPHAIDDDEPVIIYENPDRVYPVY